MSKPLAIIANDPVLVAIDKEMDELFQEYEEKKKVLQSKIDTALAEKGLIEKNEDGDYPDWCIRDGVIYKEDCSCNDCDPFARLKSLFEQIS